MQFLGEQAMSLQEPSEQDLAQSIEAYADHIKCGLHFEMPEAEVRALLDHYLMILDAKDAMKELGIPQNTFTGMFNELLAKAGHEEIKTH